MIDSTTVNDNNMPRFGALTLFAYRYITQLGWVKTTPALAGLALIPLSVIFLILSPSPKPGHVWIAEGALIGFTLGWLYMDKNLALTVNRFQEKAILVLLAFGGIALLYVAFDVFAFSMPRSVKLYSQYFLVALWVSAGVSSLYRKVCHLLGSSVSQPS